MIIDSLSQFSDAQVVTALGDTASTNVIDTLVDSDEGIGEGVHVLFAVPQAVTSAGAATVQFVIQTSTDNATFADIGMTEAIPKASLVAGYSKPVRLPVGCRRYIRVAYRVGTATLTTGAFTSAIVKDIQMSKVYGSGFTV
jgi:hypothetical protein